jgi:hypothetical protein
LLRRLNLVVALSGVLLTISSCGKSSSEPETAGLRLDQIEVALDAVEEVAGLNLNLFEVNATTELVNIFVATDLDGVPNDDGLPDAVKRYVFTEKDGLEIDPELVGANGPTFQRSVLDYDPTSILNKVLAELPNSTPQMFVITAAGTAEASTGTVQYRLLMQSTQGGQMSVVLTNAGEIVGTDAE